MASDPNSPPTTTFVQADPSTFRAVVQRLTGATPSVPPPNPTRKPEFKLQERRQTTGKLEITLNNGFRPSGIMSPAGRYRGFTGGEMMPSPVSTLDVYGRGSPRTSVEEEEERAILEKGFYLHPSPISTPRGSAEPELLVLFPLCSPKTGSDSSGS